MACNWMRPKLAKLKAEGAKRMQDHNATCEVTWYATSRKAKSNKARPTGVNKAELQEIVANYTGKIKKEPAGYALYGRNTFQKRSGVCTRGTWGRN